MRKLVTVMGLVVLLFAASSARAQEQPNETYWHIISDSGVPEAYLQFAGLTENEVSKALPVLAEYDAKYQALRNGYNKLSGEAQVLWAQSEFLTRKDALAKEYDARLTGLLSPRSLLGLHKRIGEVASNTKVISMTGTHSMVVPASYHLMAQMGGPTCHPSFHYNHTWAMAVSPANPNTGTAGALTITSSVSGYTYISNNQCTTTHQGHVQAQAGTNATPAQNYGYAAATAHMLVSVSQTAPISTDPNDPAYSDSGIEFGFGGSVHCPTFGYLIAFTWYPQKLQVEIANTTSNLNPSTRYWNGTTHVYSPTTFCSGSWAPDFPGPDVAFGNEPFGSTIDDFSANFIRTQDFGWRWSAWGADFTGLPWSWFNLPRTFIGSSATPYLQMAIANGAGICTRKDPPSSSPSF